VFNKQQRIQRLTMNVSSIKSTSSSTATMYKPNNWNSTVILWTLNKRKNFSHSSTWWLSIYLSISRMIHIFPALKSMFLSQAKPPKMINFFFFFRKWDKWNILVAHTVLYECFPITHSRKWKGQQLCCWSVKTKFPSMTFLLNVKICSSKLNALTEAKHT
jgi:hypothetical protein